MKYNDREYEEEIGSKKSDETRLYDSISLLTKTFNNRGQLPSADFATKQYETPLALKEHEREL